MRTDGGGGGDGMVWMDRRYILKVGIACILNMRGERKKRRPAPWLLAGGVKRLKEPFTEMRKPEEEGV